MQPQAADRQNNSVEVPRSVQAKGGLTSERARQLLATHGFNEPVARHQSSQILQFLHFFANPLVIILLIAAGISAAVGDSMNAGIIVVMVLLSVMLNFVQASRSQRAAEQLRKDVAPTATALRDGQWRDISRRELVPGDVVQLTAGNLVPADACLLEARDLHVQQAALTGESLPVQKEAQPNLPSDSQDPADALGMVFLGTSVVSGTATAQVVATGSATLFGKIAERLAEKAPETEFERGMRQFGGLIARVVIFLVLFVFLVNAALHRNTFESLLFAIALAVGLTPEFLPMISTVTLGRGALRMAQQKVIVKHLAAIQNFGSIDILCSDKTGTLTSGEMKLDEHLDPLGKVSERPFVLAYLNSLFETGVANPLDHAIKHVKPPARRRSNRTGACRPRRRPRRSSAWAGCPCTRTAACRTDRSRGRVSSPARSCGAAIGARPAPARRSTARARGPGRSR